MCCAILLILAALIWALCGNDDDVKEARRIADDTT